LRYLKRLSDFGLVSEALRERSVLMKLAADLVTPVELLFPILKQGGMPRFMVKTGLTLYDKLAGKYKLELHRAVPPAEVAAKAPILDLDTVGAVYSFWDGQTDDLGLVARVAAMNSSPSGDQMRLLTAIVTQMVEQRSAMHVKMGKMDEDMMKHMMHHMEAGTESMAKCPMMAGMNHGDAK
jgi:glycerol-3-phosphate dehydrogenase